MQIKWLSWLERHTSAGDYVSTVYVREPKEKMMRYIWKKRAKLIGILLVILLLAFLLCALQQPESLPLSDGNYLTRSEEGRDLHLYVEGKKGDTVWEREVMFSLGSREFSENEKKELTEKTEQYLRKKLPGENASLETVRENLVFPVTIPQTNMEIVWTVDEAYLDGTGHIHFEKIQEEGMDTDIMAEAQWKNWKKTFHFPIHIVPKQWSQEDIWSRQVKEVVEKHIKEQADKERVELPQKIGDVPVTYSMEKPEKSYLPVYIVLGVIFLLPLVWREEEKKKLREREEQLLFDYSGLVHKFMLLLGAGLTVRKIVERLVGEYETERQKGGKKRYVYEELCVLLQEMKDGVSESKAMEHFGRRCRLLPYLRFSSVITQNLKKGAEGLLAILETESMEAMEQRKEMALQLGEKAGTKLLFPMMLMLGIVMGIIMVPAFMTM